MGPETSDDAGVYRISSECALVETVDIITPLVDDPRTFGRIAAANALSDVYAMGGRPVTAMNLAFFPACALPGDVLADVMAGGMDVLRQSGTCLAGGHTVEDDELKYGLAVTGLIHPDRIVRNSTARPGDQLILTKPLGTGIVSTAIKGEMASAALTAEAIEWMTTLNRETSELMLRHNVSAATDVTGFGLLGHASEMARGAAVTISIDVAAVPLISGIQELILDGMLPAGCYRNRDHYLPLVADGRQDDDRLLPLFDPQTSGGLLMSFAPTDAERFLAAAHEAGLFARLIGSVLPQSSHPLVLT